MKNRIISFLVVVSMVFMLLPAVVFAVPSNVSNFNEFKAALESPAVTVINLVNDIYMERDRDIDINPNKTSLVVEGNGRTIFQTDSNRTEYAIQFDTSRSLIKEVSFRNLIIIGRNKRGFVYMPNSSRYDGFTVNFENVNYVGPAMVKAKWANVNITNTNILVVPGFDDQNGFIAEASNVTLAGSINIKKEAPNSTRTLFCMHRNGNLKVAANANVNILNNTIGAKTPRMAGFARYISLDGALIFDTGAKFRYEGNCAFIYGADIGQVYVGRNATVEMYIHGDLFSCDGMFSFRESMTVDNGAILRMVALSNTSMREVIESHYKGSFIVNNPREVLIYNSSTKPHKEGLAIHNVTNMNLVYNNVRRVEYWIHNKAPYNALGAASYSFRNSNNASFDANINMCVGRVKSVSTARYTAGLTPINSSTADFRNVNVIYISGTGGFIEV